MTTYIDVVAKPVQVQEIAQYLDKLQFANAPPKDSERLTEYKALVDQKKYFEIMEKLLHESELVFGKGTDGGTREILKTNDMIHSVVCVQALRVSKGANDQKNLSGGL